MNSLYNDFNSGKMNQMNNLINQFNQFRSTFSGNPEQQVKQLISSGRMSRSNLIIT